MNARTSMHQIPGTSLSSLFQLTMKHPSCLLGILCSKPYINCVIWRSNLYTNVNKEHL